MPKPSPTPKPKPKPPAPPEPDPEPEITQAELVRYRRLKARQKLLDADVSELTRSLIDRVKRRASVERGKWIVGVYPQESRQFSKEIVAEAFGEKAMLEVFATIKPTVRETLTLTQAKSE